MHRHHRDTGSEPALGREKTSGPAAVQLALPRWSLSTSGNRQRFQLLRVIPFIPAAEGENLPETPGKCFILPPFSRAAHAKRTGSAQAYRPNSQKNLKRSPAPMPLIFCFIAALLFATSANADTASEPTSIYGTRGENTSPGATHSPRVARDDNRYTPDRAGTLHGMRLLQISAAKRRASGIATARIESIEFSAETHAFGSVVDLRPLLTLRARYAETKADLAATRATVAASRRAYQRLAELHRQDAISRYKLEDQHSRWQADTAQVDAASSRLRGIRENALQGWGKPITQWALDGDSETFRHILDGREALLLVALPSGVTLPEDLTTIQVENIGSVLKRRSAHYVSPAPMTDSATQGETYFFRTKGDNLRTGMRLAAWIPQPNRRTHGALIPASAVVWHGGRAWCYIQLDEERFVRRVLRRPVKRGSAWLVEDRFASNEKVVTVGAQLLLSEEFRGQIPDEDDD